MEENVIKIVIDYVNEAGLLKLTLPPFLIWLVGGILYLGFVPLAREKRSSKDKSWKYVFRLGLKRAFAYKWELLFTAIGLGALTDFYFLLLALKEKLLPAFPELLAWIVGFVLLLFLFAGKIAAVYPRPPSGSCLNSVRFIYGEFSNPFKEYERYRIE